MSDPSDASTAPRTPRRRGPFYIHIDGLFVSYRSRNIPRRNIRGQLVSHAFVDLLRQIQDGQFSKELFDMLDERERNFMGVLLQKCKIQSHAFESARNVMAQALVNRLGMLMGALQIGDDNPHIQAEIEQLLERLYQNGTFSRQLMLHMRRSFTTGGGK